MSRASNDSGAKSALSPVVPGDAVVTGAIATARQTGRQPAVHARTEPPADEQQLHQYEAKPLLEVSTETLLVESGTGYHEREVAVLRLWFEYGSQQLRISDPREGFFVSQSSGVARIYRNKDDERRAQTVIESFGAVELSCLEELGMAADADADYLVSINDSVHSLCSFSAYAIPQLRELGWKVEIDHDYPYQVVNSDAPWFANLAREPDADDDDGKQKSDWFSLELGVEVDGERHDLLPALLELLRSGSDSESLSSLFRAHGRFRALPIGDNKYVVMPPERLKLLLVVLEELHGDGDEGITLKGSQASSLAALDEVFGETSSDTQLEWFGETDVVARGRNLLAGPPQLEHTQTPQGLHATLREYQQEGLNWLQHLIANGAGGVLADDMGLGKTLQTIAHLAAEKESRRMRLPSLVVMPTSLTGNWQREIAKFAPFLRTLVIHGSKRHTLYEKINEYNVVITTFPIIVRDLEKFAPFEFYLLILDEAQAIKNSRSLASQAVNSIKSEHRLCLTGTPVENHLGELWSLFNFLMPGFIGSRSQFRSRFQIPIEKDGNEVRLQQLRQRVAPYILRRMKHTVAKDLPPKTELVRPIELEGAQRDFYESIRLAAHSQVRQVIKKKGLAGSTITILDALMKLRQACCDPRLVASEAARSVSESAKYQFLFELLSQQLEQGHRILIFSQFTRMLALIGEGLKKAKEPYISLTGATVDRQARCDQFESGQANIFLISLKAGGTGLNLTSADTVIHYDPWWNPTAQAQATDRAYRIGQKRPVFVYSLIVAGSVEERMLKLQQRKKHLADTILSDAGPGLSEDELDDLFSPLD